MVNNYCDVWGLIPDNGLYVPLFKFLWSSLELDFLVQNMYTLLLKAKEFYL
jgi:hypothetical protein